MSDPLNFDRNRPAEVEEVLVSTRVAGVRHKHRYYDDGNVVFMVEDTLFCLHRFIFERESPIFCGLFLSPLLGRILDGKTEQRPICLENACVFDFEALVSLLYNPSHRPFSASQFEWISILHLSSQWDMADVRNLAVQQLESFQLDFVDKLVLAQKYNISDWLVPCYIGLCRRSRPLSLTEAKRVGVEVSTIIAQTRERSMSNMADGKDTEKVLGDKCRTGEPYEPLIQIIKDVLRDLK